jgi:hypothetical protein
MSHTSATKVGSPGFNRQLSRSGPTQKLVDLAVGTHFFEVKPGNALTVFVTSTGGTINIAFTMDPDRTLDDGVAAPGTGFGTDVQSQVWSTGASALASETIDGPVTGVLVTVITTADNVVTLAPHC